MKSIIEQLCKGEVEYVSLKLPKDRLEKEMSYYDKIKTLMTGENAVLFDEYVNTVALNYEFLILRAYTLAFKTGFQLGLEMADTEELNLDAKTNKERKVKAYLEANAFDILAEKINNGVRIQKDGKTLLNKKTLAGFLKFACDEAKKQAEKGAQSACIDDAVVYGWAVHYFEEDSIEGTLYNEDGTEYKKQPGVAAKAPTVKYTPPKPQPKPQMSMFDLLDAKPEEPDEDGPTDEEIREAVEQIAAEEKVEQPKPTVSPVYQKYLDVQSKYSQAIVAMRLGDFYEVFGDNAKLLADELDLTLTGRDCGLESRVPMVGFPYHASDVYFGKILSNGYTLVVMENGDEVRELSAKQNVDLETGEIFSEEEMREFDGDMEEPDIADDEPDISAFDTEALAVLDEMFGNEITLR